MPLKIPYHLQYSYVSAEFVKSKFIEKMIIHLDVASTLLHKDSEEAKIQMQKEDGTFEEGMKPTRFINFICKLNSNLKHCLIYLIYLCIHIYICIALWAKEEETY